MTCRTWTQPLLLGMILCCRVFVAAAENTSELGHLFVENFTARDYHGKPLLYAARQGPDRRMFFVNFGALVIYDGHTWEYAELSDRPLITDLPASDGSVYVSPIDDFGRARRGPDGKWTYESLADRLPSTIKPLGQIYSIIEADGDILFATARHIVALPHGDVARARIWSSESPHSAAKLTDVQRVPLLSASEGRAYVFQTGVGLRLYLNHEFEAWHTDCAMLRELDNASVYGSYHGHVRILKNDGRMFIVDDAGVPQPWHHEAEALLKHDPVRSMAYLNNPDVVFLTTNHSGAIILGAHGELLRRINESTGLETNTNFGVCLDYDGGVWICHQSGASRVEIDPRVTIFDRLNGVGASGFLSAERFRDRLFAASEDGFFRLDPADATAGRPARWTRLEFGKDLPRVLIPHDDELLVGTLQQLGRWDGEHLQPISSFPGQIVSFCLRGDRELLIGTEHGVRVFRRDGKQWTAAFDSPPIDSVVLSIVSAGGDDFWLGTLSRGVLRITVPPTAKSGDEVSVRAYTAAEGLNSPSQNFLITAHRSGPLFFSADALFRYDPATDRFSSDRRFTIDGQTVRKFELLTSVPDGRIFAQAILPDSGERRMGWFSEEGGAWAWHGLTNRYLTQLGPAGAAGFYYDDATGRQVLWAFGADKTLRIELDALESPTPRLHSLIRSASQGLRSIGVDSPRLPFSTQPIHFDFASPSFAAGTAIRHQWRMLGYDENWTAPIDRQEADFTNLTSGQFTFEVRAIDVDGRVGDPARLAFTVIPPWHRTTWAYVLYALALAGVVLCFVRWRLGKSERERRRLESLIAHRTAELATAKDAADEANRAKSTFLANMSHELRTPLNGVIGYAQVLMKSPDVSPRDRERLHIVQTSGEHLLRMINEVLDFSKIEAGKMELTTTPFHLPQLLRDIAAANSTRFEQKHLEFVFDPSLDLPDLVIGDPLKLRQVIENLLGNAAKFTAAGTVRFQARIVATETVEFSVADTGSGISAADLARLFQPFQQAVDARPPEPGTGLGLAISQRLVALMDGRLEVESTPDRGSRFFFTAKLPFIAADSAARRSTASLITGYHGPRRRLLVVDDIATNRAVIRELLEPLGFEITEAPNATEALALAPALQPDVVFLDLRMPGMDGLELARRLRTLLQGSPMKLIAMSASVLSFNREKAFAAGCDDFLPKPFREDDLLARLGLALQLEWIGDAAKTARTNSRPPFASTPTTLDAGTLGELLAMTRRGEITTLRRRLEDYPDDPLATQLAALAQTYRMELIRERLERQLSASPPAP